MYGRYVLSGRKCCNFVAKGTFDLCCTARARKFTKSQVNVRYGFNYREVSQRTSTISLIESRVQ